MTPLLIVAAVLILGAGLTYLARQRSVSGGLEGVHGFRRHMDALSSEARRDVIGRLQTGDEPDEHHQPAQRIAGQPGVGGRMSGDTSDPFGGSPFDEAATTKDVEAQHDNNGEGTEAKG